MLHLKQNQILARKYKLVELVGRGGFAEVWKVINMDADIVQAAKIYTGIDEFGHSVLKREFVAFYKHRHVSILNASELGKHEGITFLIMEYCPHGTALDRAGKMEEEDIWDLVRAISSGLNYLHREQIIHKDIKPDNFLINDRQRYVLSDLGISDKASRQLMQSISGRVDQLDSNGNPIFIGRTPMAYRAPELFVSNTSNESYGGESFASDIWAFGASIYEVITMQFPFGSSGGISQKLAPDILPDFPDKYSSALKKLVLTCLQASPEGRPNAAELLNMAAYPPAHPGLDRNGHESSSRTTQRIIEADSGLEPLSSAIASDTSSNNEERGGRENIPPTPSEVGVRKRQQNFRGKIFLGIGVFAMLIFCSIYLIRAVGGSDNTSNDALSLTYGSTSDYLLIEDAQFLQLFNTVANSNLSDDERMEVIPSIVGNYFTSNAMISVIGRNGTEIEKKPVAEYLKLTAISPTILKIEFLEVVGKKKIKELKVKEQHDLLEQ